MLEPAIYLIPECDILHELCEEIFVEQLAGWFNDTTTWPLDRGFDVFCRWFDYQHHSMLDRPEHIDFSTAWKGQ